MAGALLGVAVPAHAEPIPERPTANSIPEFVGAPWTPQPLSLLDAPTPPRHPFMAPNDRSNLHDYAYQTDTANWQGPLGREMQRTTSANLGVCGSVTFDSKDRIVTVCVGAARPTLKLLDPRTLEELATYEPRSDRASRSTSSRTSPAAATSTSTTATGRSSPRPPGTYTSWDRPRRPASGSSATSTCRAP